MNRLTSRSIIPYVLLASTMVVMGTVNAQTTTNILVTPDVFPPNHFVGVPSDAAPGYASGSFASDGIAKSDIYFTPDALFHRPVNLGEIARMSYWTKTGDTHVVDPADWYLVIYTVPYSGDCSSGSWYGDRIGTEPYFSININDPANAWNEWSTDGAQNQLRFFESTQGCTGANFGSYTDPEWDTFVAGNALSGDPLTGHGILYISIQTGSAWADFTGQLDGFEVELTDGSVATINFETPIVAETFTCSGFKQPFDTPMSVKKKAKRALPLKFNLFDENSNEITDTDLTNPPIVQVMFDSDTGSEISGYEGDLLPNGLSDDGNQFRYDPDSMQWILNLGLKTYTGSGEYTISVVAGDETYIVEGCSETFTRQ